MRFQSTHPCGVRPEPPPINPVDSSVSIHAPVWGATMIILIRIILILFQSTHPCGVRPLNNNLPSKPIRFQSTHPGGVRLKRLVVEQGENWFQSTHPCGVRPHQLRPCAWRGSFNPRTRVGCDCPILPRNYNRRVSIHAPVWGATLGAMQWI